MAGVPYQCLPGRRTMHSNRLALAVMFFLSLATYSIAQEGAKGKESQSSQWGNRLDQGRVQEYLGEIDKEIGKLVPQYPQLSEWNVPRKGMARSDAGKMRTDTGL